MISYEGLMQKLNDKGLTKTALTEELGVSSRTIAKIGRGEKIADRVLAKIAAFLDCTPEELYRSVSDNVLLQMLRDEKSIRMPGGLYHELQVRMTYNSNHIEGSKLSEDQTRLIFETNTVDVGEGIPVDDIIETVNHFRDIDYVIDHAEEPLTKCVTDMTEIKGCDGKLYVSAIFDCFDSSVIGLAMDTNMKATLCKETL